MFLPEGEDPDTQVRKIGKESFEKLIEQAQSLSTFFFSSLREGISDGHKRISDSVQLSLKGTTDTLNQRFAELSQMAERRLDGHGASAPGQDTFQGQSGRNPPACPPE